MISEPVLLAYILAVFIPAALLARYIIRIRQERDRNSRVIDRLCEERINDTKEREKAEREWSQRVSALKAINFILEEKREGMRKFLKRYGRELKALKKQKEETDKFMSLAGSSMGRVNAIAERGLRGIVATPNKALREIILLITHTDIAFSELSRSRSQETQRKDILANGKGKSQSPNKSTAKKVRKSKGKGMGMGRVSYKKLRRLADKTKSKIGGN